MSNIIISASLSTTDMEYIKDSMYDENNEHNPLDFFIQNAVDFQVKKSEAIMKKKWYKILENDESVSGISASREDFLGQVQSRPEYQNRWTAMSASLAEGP